MRAARRPRGAAADREVAVAVQGVGMCASRRGRPEGTAEVVPGVLGLADRRDDPSGADRTRPRRGARRPRPRARADERGAASAAGGRERGREAAARARAALRRGGVRGVAVASGVRRRGGDGHQQGSRVGRSPVRQRGDRPGMGVRVVREVGAVRVAGVREVGYGAGNRTTRESRRPRAVRRDVRGRDTRPCTQLPGGGQPCDG